MLNDLKAYRVKQFQTIQKRIGEINILLMIDDDIIYIDHSADLIFKDIKEALRKRLIVVIIYM
jgi:hypothetical protein